MDPRRKEKLFLVNLSKIIFSSMSENMCSMEKFKFCLTIMQTPLASRVELAKILKEPNWLCRK